MDDPALVRSKGRLKRLAMQKSLFTNKDETSFITEAPSISGILKTVLPKLGEKKIETTAEVLTEIPAHLKNELKLKRKKFRTLSTDLELKTMTYTDEISRDSENESDVSPFKQKDGVHLLSKKVTSRHGIDNEGLSYSYSDDPTDDFDSGVFLVQEKLPQAQQIDKTNETSKTPANNSTQPTDNLLSPVCLKRREKMQLQSIDKQNETAIDIPSFSQEKQVTLQSKPKPLPRKKKKEKSLPLKKPAVQPGLQVNEQESFEFFTLEAFKDEQTFQLRRNSLTADSQEPDSEIPEVVVVEDMPENTTLLLKQDYFHKSSEYYMMCHRKPHYLPLNERLKKEQAILFTPSSEQVPIHMKVPEGAEPQVHLEEGQHSTLKPNISQRNINTVENRLLKQQELQWFGKDGHLIMPSSPVCAIDTNYSLFEESTTAPETVYVKASIDPCNQRLNKEKPYQLDLEMSSISFTHHPLFSKEHVLTSHLTQMCNRYIAYDHIDASSNRHKLKELQKVVNEMKENVHNEESQILYFETCKKEIRQLTKMCNLQEAEHHGLVRKISSLWEDLKLLRETQGYSSTSLRVEISSCEVLDESDEKVDWEKHLKAEVQAEKEEFELKYRSAVREYKSLVSKWKEIHRAQKHAMKRQKKREMFARKKSLTREDKLAHEELEATSTEDELILSQPELMKPQMPPKFDSKAVLERLTQNALISRKPGDPKTTIKIEYDNPVTATEKCPKLEMQRRCSVSKTRLFFRIIYNDKIVSETSYRNLNQDFSAFWGQIFKLRIIHFPLNFKIEIFEYGVTKKTKLAEVFIPIPDSTLTSLNSKLEEHHFSTDHIISTRHGGVGSGVLFKFEKDSQSWLLTSGKVRCSLLWGVNEDNIVLAPPKRQENISLLSEMKKSTPLGSLLSSGISSIAELKNWIKNSKFDATNPTNIELLQAVQEFRSEFKDNQNSDDSSGYFRLEPHQEIFDFVSTEELNSNQRFHLLELRSQDILEFRNFRMVPADENQLDPEVIELMHKKSTNDAHYENEFQRDVAQQIRQKVREDVAKRFYLSQHQRTLEDVVVEESVPNIGTLGFGLLKLFQRKRPLYPVRKERKKVTGQSVGNTEVRIMVTVLRAMNIPLRTDVDPIKDHMKRHSSVPIEPDFESQVRPFVEVMFQRVSSKTNVAEGPHPTWNQELSLPFNVANGDFSPANLEKVNNNIYFNIFDEVAVDLLEDDKDRESVIYQRLERRWLGSLEIPFTTLYLNSKIDGTFRVNTPLVLLGYENEQCHGLIDSSPNASTSHTYLSLFITVEPCLQLPEIFREKWDSGEPERVLHEVDYWEQNVISHFPERFIKVMAVDLSGKWIFVSRFLHPISPPEELLHAGKDTLETWELLARFVALIPTVSDSAVYPGLCDIWSISDQFLQMLMGDEEEHAMLLCNYFLHIGKKAMLLLGLGIPEGPTAYVLTLETGDDIWVWNATNGEHFSIRDSYSPLQRVGCLVSEENVWANIQKHDHPSRINYDLSRANDWKPFFSRSFPNPGLKTVQPSSLVYTATDPEFVQKLQDKLKQNLQGNIMKWRQRHCTSWNNYCSQVLYKILTRLERNAGRTASFDSLQELEQVLCSHKMNGFPLSMPYTDMDSVIEAVFATGVHLTEDKNAEFSLAVYVHPYPCSVLAVWVYVAVLTSRCETE